MSDNYNLSNVPSKGSFKTVTRRETNTHLKRNKREKLNWHEAVSCAIQIDLKDYSSLLEYKSEYILGKNSYRIDLLVIKKLTADVIPKHIAAIFQGFNLFEIKGIGSSVTINSYYKTIGYAGLLINQINSHQTSEKRPISAADISLTLLSFHYPKKLIQHLKNDRKIEVAKYAPGVYHINKETFTTQIIVTKELTAEENLYLRCLTDRLKDMALADRLLKDYQCHHTQPVYNRYMCQLATACQKKKGEKSMVDNEWIFELCGTSSDEIIERTRQEDADYYLPQIDSLSADNSKLSADNNKLSAHIKDLFSQITYLKSLLEQNHIPFHSDLETQSGQ